MMAFLLFRIGFYSIRHRIITLEIPKKNDHKSLFKTSNVMILSRSNIKHITKQEKGHHNVESAF